MSTEYECQRLKNIEANRKLLESLGLDVLCATLPRVSAPVAKPKVKPQVKAKAAPVKRKAEQIEGDAEDGKTKMARLDGEDDTTRRRSTRRSTIKVDYNEDKLADNRQKYLQRQKEQAEDAAEDAAGYVGNKLGKRKNDPYVDHRPTDNGVLARSAGNNSVRSQESRLELGGKLGICYLTSIVCRNLTFIRAQCSFDAIHAPFVAGISGNSIEGAYSVALSGGYDDDVDLGYALCVSH